MSQPTIKGEEPKICLRHQIYAYDAYVISCAKDFKLPILTLDKAMISIAGKEHVKIMEL